MKKEAEKIVADFYNTIGWDAENDITGDALKYEDLRKYAQEYVVKCRQRVNRYLPERGENLLDMASGPVQFPEYLDYSRNFTKRWCVDLSQKALDKAKEKIGDHGVFLCGSFFDIDLPENFFDCSLSVHTIYHMDKNRQAEAVRKLIKVTRPGSPVVIVYSNPAAWGRYLYAPVSLIKKGLRFFRKIIKSPAYTEELYFYAHPLKWWKQFRDEAEISMFPWRSFTNQQQKLFFPNNRVGRWMFSKLYQLEEKYPDFFVRHFQYPIVVLKKKKVPS
ncbi:MAG TPA: class I SAM-dependent methyltransferase [Bacteroidia bacterium]|nr:class I SAM-dependent methyltransferase [Bacteroidia bacterium]HRS58527.1 class I SAM-dependent methyltransferase [Bacteroidia bacterium]HRU69047.1 class I SAM-dependent methyltransferase [Bacteroidia bacterium]